MIITTIHIDRFGGLRDLTLRPEAGVNVFFGPNESGKSTVAGFIKSLNSPQVTSCLPSENP